MAKNTNQIDYIRTTTMPFTYTYKKNGTASTDGVTLFFTVKTSQYDTSTNDTTAVVKKDISFAGDSTVSFTIDPSDIAVTQAPGLYYYDFKVKEAGATYPGVNGRFNLIGYPTNRTS